jgi:3-dehydroquinate dehydratase II
MPRRTLKILVANGVNLDLLGRRQTEIYGASNLKDVEQIIRGEAAALRAKNQDVLLRLSFFQTNDETRFLTQLDKGYDGAIINAGAWTHTSLALADRLAGLGLPFVEVHISDTSRREDFRKISYMAAHAVRVIAGKGINGYPEALRVIVKHLLNSK